jgi:hypothetical protein
MSSDALRSKSVRAIEQKMEALEPGSMRYRVLESAKNFKSSWIALGQILYTVYKDKLFKGWSYMTFEAYCRGELGLQKQTATKLLYSYYFLEKHEPQFLRSVQSQEAVSPKDIPSVDAVNVLRLAANRKELSEEDYQDFKKSVFEEGKDAKEVRKEVGLRLRSLQEEEDPQKVRAERRQKTLQRFVMTLKGLQKEVVPTRLVSDRTAKELDRLLECLQKELSD